VFGESDHKGSEFTVSIIPGICVVGENGEGGADSSKILKFERGRW
jgi:hypothetical protein